MSVRTRRSMEAEERIALRRNRLVLEQARAVGLLSEAKNTRLSGRVPAGLIEAEEAGSRIFRCRTSGTRVVAFGA